VLRYSFMALAFAAMAPVVAVAETPQPSDAAVPATSSSLTLTDAVGRVLRNNPALQAAVYSLRAQEARRDQAALKPAWHATLEAENFLGTGSLRNGRGLETTLRLGTVIERGDKRTRRIDQADSERALLVADQDVARLDLLAEVARRFIHVVSDQQSIALTERATALARRSVELVEQRVRAAKAGDAELGKTRITLARAEISAEHAEHELKSSRIALAATWNAREAGFDRADAAFYTLPEPESFDALIAGLERNPNLARFASAQRLEDAHIAVARANRTADIGFNAGIRRVEAQSDQAFVLSVTVPFGSASRAAPFEREAEQRREAVDAEASGVRTDLYRTLYAVYQELLHARTQADTLRTRVIPESERTLKLTEQGFAVGRYSYLELVDAQQQLLTVQREAVDAAREYHLLYVELERLVGRSIGTAAMEKNS